MKKMVLKLAGVALLSALVFGACGNKDKGTTESSAPATSSSAKEEAKSEKIKVTDSEGTEVEVTTNPQKVVVFDMGTLDTIKELGKADTVAGVALDNLPAYLKDTYGKVESAGGIKEPDLEAINAMKPDLIIISGRQSDAKADLEKIAPVLYLGTDTKDTWGSIQSNVELLGKIYGAEDVAKEKIASLQKEIDAIKEQATAAKKKALVVLVNEGSLSAYGPGSRFGIIHDVFGFPAADEAIEASTHGQEVSYEYVLEKNPDIIFVVDRTKAIGGDDANNDVAANDLVKQTTAGKDGKVITLTPDVWYLSGGGLESTDLMIQDAKKGLE